jgi:hypothetical protein
MNTKVTFWGLWMAGRWIPLPWVVKGGDVLQEEAYAGGQVYVLEGWLYLNVVYRSNGSIHHGVLQS